MLVRRLEIDEADAAWSRENHERQSHIRRQRWDEVRSAAFEKLRYHRNTEQALTQLHDQRTAQELRNYADQVIERAGTLAGDDAGAAVDWAGWIRRHADTIDPLNGPLQQLGPVTSAAHDELAQFMDGWSTYGPHC